MRERVEDVLAQIRRNINGDGGDIQLVDVRDGVVTVRVGGCCTCPMTKMVLRRGLEGALRDAIPEIVRVEIQR